jgi:UDP-N-acetyl-D-galactosamine dehydrogenase
MQWDGASAVAAFSHGIAALAFGLLALGLLRRDWRKRPHARAIAAAALVTALWACCALLPSAASLRTGAVAVTEALRTASWLAVLLLLSGAGWRALAGAMLLPAVALAVAIHGDAAPLLEAALPLASSVLGMLLVEHLYRNAPQNTRWGIKFACLGMGALFAYDFYLYSDAMLMRHVNPDIWAARGIVNALSAPLLGIAISRGPAWTPVLQLSRQIMFHSAALLGAAMYLLAMAISAWYLRYVGGAWGALMQLACLGGAALLLTATLFSGAMRARLKLFISKHFYQGRYDYREEWQRVTRALADDAAGLSEHAIQAVAGLVESPAGLLWLRREEDIYQPTARWNWPLPQVEERADSPLCRLLAIRNWVVELPEWHRHPARYDDQQPPAWAMELWLVVPLMLDRSLFGFICLAPPRTNLQLNWEVRDVLKIAGSQAASYVGLSLAVAFGARCRTIGLDLSARKVASYRRGIDPAGEVSAAQFDAARWLELGIDPVSLAEADYIVVAVPTPVDDAHNPDFRALEAASQTVGRHMKTGAVVIYESTVYPGATEEVCIPILEQCSGLRWQRDFHVGFSPERINPGDQEHRLATIRKVVSGDDAVTLDRVAALYEGVVEAGVHRASSIKVAEAAKVIENTQRDLNIALMNELAVIFDRLDIDTLEVLQAAGTKWNFLPFRPGLVGGHCIGVDPYYLTHRAAKSGYHPEVILAGRRINDSMAKFVAEKTVKEMVRAGFKLKGCHVNVLGLTFKENCPDLRNSKVADLIRELQSYGLQVHVHDPVADADEAHHEYGVALEAWDDLPAAEALISAVAHRDLMLRPLHQMLGKVAAGGCFIDLKSQFDPAALRDSGLNVWRL